MSSDTVYSIGWNLLNVSTSMDNRRILNDRRITRDEVLSSLVNLRQLTFEVTDACNPAMQVLRVRRLIFRVR